MAGSEKRRGPSPQRLILDSGAVIALSRGNLRVRAFVEEALERGAVVEVPVVVVAETVRGGAPDAGVNRVLKAVGSIPEATESHGRIAGRLLGTARSASTINALVVAHAVEARGAHILTGDREDLEKLAAPHPEVWIQSL